MDRSTLYVVLFLAAVGLATASPKHGKSSHGHGNGHMRTNIKHGGGNHSLLREAAKNPLRKHNKIVGGTEANIEDFPYQVALIIYKGEDTYMCGGSILNEEWILSAAHCVAGDVTRIVVHAGTTNFFEGDEHEVSEFQAHPEYDAHNFNHDVSLLKLADPLKLNDKTIKAVQLTQEEPADGTDITISGWGATAEGSAASPEQLMTVTVPKISREECNNQYNGGITEFMICAGYSEGGKDSCQGDSGGPAVDHNHVQVGVVSFGEGCARKGIAGVYSNVAELREYIKEVTGV